MADQPLTIRIRVKQGRNVVFGPGKAQLLEGIARTGSIAAAGRDMSMSYKRAWMLIEGLNTAFGSPLVETIRGGSTGGGATLTLRGQQVLDLYHRLVKSALEATAQHCRDLEALLADDKRPL